jgi:ubiquinone/menaquinone biosynthesis C-methylase UbiE
MTGVAENKRVNNAYSEIEVATRYDSARSLPTETEISWLEALTSAIAKQKMRRILDLGCGPRHILAATDLLPCVVSAPQCRRGL